MATVQGTGRGARWYWTIEAVCTWTLSEARSAMWGTMVLVGLVAVVLLLRWEEVDGETEERCR